MKAQDYYEKKKHETNKSFAFLIKRCPHSENAPYGIELCQKIEHEKPLLLVLPGTTDENDELHLCNGLLKKVDNFVFQNFDKKSLQVCAAVCRFGKFFDPDTARQLLYLFYKDYKTYEKRLDNFEENEQQEYIFPQYAKDIFEQVFVPRLFKTDFLPFEQALKNVQKLVVLTYCHGAYTLMKVEKFLNHWLKKSPYSDKQKKILLKSITVLAYSPDCPLGYSKMQFISLASASDLTLKHGNGFVSYVHRDYFVMDFGLSYLSEKYGNVFYCAKYSNAGVEGNPQILIGADVKSWFENLHYEQVQQTEKVYVSEHDFLSFNAFDNMSNSALKLQKIGIQILINALNNALAEKTKLLSVFDLIGGFKHNFWSCLRAKIKGWFFIPIYFWWNLNPHRSSFADNVRFVKID